MPKNTKQKPDKPSPDFPLWAHPNGQWCKKIDNKPHYFGKWDDPDAAEASYDEHINGKRRHDPDDGIELVDLCNAFMDTKTTLLELGELTPSHVNDLQKDCQFMLNILGKRRVVSTMGSADFTKLRTALPKTQGPNTVAGFIRRIKSVFAWAASEDEQLIDRTPRYGSVFKPPSAKIKRKLRSEKGDVSFTAEELHAIFENTKTKNRVMNAMVHLGINAGLGNTDIANLPFSAIDFESGWLVFPRTKTGVPRRCPLWPETIDSLRRYLEKRKTPKNEADKNIVFITRDGWRYVRWLEDKKREVDVIAQLAYRLLTRIKIKRPGLSFYSLRKTFQTIGGPVDPVATESLMGWTPKSDDMSAVYRQRVEDDQRRAVTDHVRAWLNKNVA